MMYIDKGKLAVAMLSAGIDSAKALSEVSGVSVNTLSRINNGGGTKVATLRKLSAALGCSPADVILKGD